MMLLREYMLQHSLFAAQQCIYIGGSCVHWEYIAALQYRDQLGEQLTSALGK